MDFNNILSMLGNNPQLAQSLMQMMGGGKGGGKMDNNAMMSILPQLFANQKPNPMGQTPNGQQSEQTYTTQQSENFNENKNSSATQQSAPTYTVHSMPINNDEVNYTLFKLSQE